MPPLGYGACKSSLSGGGSPQRWLLRHLITGLISGLILFLTRFRIRLVLSKFVLSLVFRCQWIHK